MKQEKRTIQAGSELIFHMIYSQAGSLEKALAEYVMNSADAGATEAALNIDLDGFSFSDDGIGFKSQAEIEGFFETLAFKHTDGDRQYGRYGLGRAQSWAFCSTKWRTGEFLMDVDVKRKGLDYLLSSNLPRIKGCQIDGTFYEKLLPSDLNNVTRNLEELIRYMPIPVRINGEIVSKNPEAEKWDIETDDAYIKLRSTGDLAVYNQGVLVKKFSGHQYSTGGVVVSKSNLTLNVARNDILQAQCKVWPRIRRHLSEIGAEKTKKNTKLKDHERQFLAARFLAGDETYESIKSIKFIPDVKGRMMSLEQLARHKSFTIAPESGSRVGERIMNQKLELVLDPSVVSLFLANSPEEMADRLAKMSLYPHTLNVSRIQLKFSKFEDFESLISDVHELLDAKKITSREKAALKALSSATAWEMPIRMFRTVGLSDRKNRTLFAGKSETADAWTDGSTMIGINLPMLKLADRGVAGFFDLMCLLAHEYVHDAADLGSHEHDHDFYQAYHDITALHGATSLSAMAVKAANSYNKLLEMEGVKPNRARLRDADRQTILDRNSPEP